MEKWKPLKENPDYYEISDHGNIRSIGFRNQWGYYKRKNPITLKKTKSSGSGYYMVSIVIDDCRCLKSVHRLVASNFIGNTDNLTVNHKDGNKLNNSASNLEICTLSENTLHAFRVLKIKNGMTGHRGSMSPRSKAIACYDMKGNIVKVFESVRIAADTIRHSHAQISNAARNGNKAFGYYWSFINK